MVDVWDWTFRRLKIAGLLGKVDCPCCQRRDVRVARRRAWARTRRPSAAATPCRSPPAAPSRSNFAEMAGRLAPLGEVRHNAFMLRFAAEGLRVHRLPRRPGHHQGDQRHRQGTHPLRPVRRESDARPAPSPRPRSAETSTMIYLDNAATSFPKPEPVYQALDRSPGRGWPIPGGPGTGWRWPPSGPWTTRGTRLNQFFQRRGARALDLHAQLHRRPEPGDQGDGQAGRPRHHVRPGAQLDQPAAPRAGEGRASSR